MRERLASEAVAILLLLSAIVKLVGTRFALKYIFQGGGGEADTLSRFRCA